MTPPSPKLMEKARKILVEDIWNPGFSPLSSSDFMHLREAIALALQQHGDEQRNEALEEAAKVAQWNWANYTQGRNTPDFDRGWTEASEKIQKSIRNLKDKV